MPTLPLCDLDDLVFTVDIEQGTTQLCSVAIEARDAMRRDLPAEVENCHGRDQCECRVKHRLDSAAEGPLR